MQEVVSLRRERSKGFDLGNGKTKLVFKMLPIHYKSGADWVEYDCVWREDHGKWIVDGAPWTAQVDPKKYEVIYTDVDGVVTICTLVSVDGSPVGATVSLTHNGKKQLQWADAFPDVDINVRASVHGIQIHRILKSAVAAKAYEWQITTKLDSKTTKVRLDAIGMDNISKTASWRAGYDEHRRVESDVQISAQQLLPDGRTRFIFSEEWTGRVAKTNVDRSKSWTTDIEYPVLIDPPFGPADIAAYEDDGYETNGSAWNNAGAAMYGGQGSGGVTYALGFRWDNITIAKEATIDTATIAYHVRGGIGTATLQVYGADEDDAPQWTDRPSEFTKTTAYKDLSVASGADSDETADVKTIVQEIVNRGSWASSNAMRFGFFNNQGSNYKQINVDGYANYHTTPPADIATLEITLAAGGETHEGAGIAAGVGLATASGVLSAAGSAVAAGVGSMIATGMVVVAASGIAAGVGSMVATGTAEKAGAAVAAGVGSVVATGALDVATSAVAAGAGLLTATGALDSGGVGTSSGVGLLTATGALELPGTAIASGVGLLEASGSTSDDVEGTAIASGVGQMVASGVVARGGTAISAGVGQLIASGEVSTTHEGAGVASGVGELVATGSIVTVGTATLAGVGQMIAVGAIPTDEYGLAVMAGVGLMTATGVTWQTPPERVVYVDAETRSVTVKAESRVVYVEAEDRSKEV